MCFHLLFSLFFTPTMVLKHQPENVKKKNLDISHYICHLQNYIFMFRLIQQNNMQNYTWADVVAHTYFFIKLPLITQKCNFSYKRGLIY